MLWIEFGRIIWCSFHCSVIWMESILVMDQKLLSLSLSNWSNDKMLAGIQIKHNVSVIYLYKQGQAGIQLGSTLSLWYGTRVHVRHFTNSKKIWCSEVSGKTARSLLTHGGVFDLGNNYQICMLILSNNF